MIDPVAVLCFASGGMRFAIAAAEVLGLGDNARTAPALATGLGLVTPDEVGPACRVVRLAGPDGAVEVVVDGPLTFRRVGVGDIVAAPPGVPLAPAVVGFARVDGELIQLLSADRVIAGLDSTRGSS